VYEQSDSLKPVADKLGLQIQTLDGVTRQPQLGAKGPLASEKFLAALFTADSVDKKRNTEAIELGANQLVAGRIAAYNPVRTLPFDEVRAQVRERVADAAALALAKRDGNDKLTQWKQDASQATQLSQPVVVSRDQPQGVAAPVVTAALRADSAALPAWVGADLGPSGFAVVRVNKVTARTGVPADTLQRDRHQYTQWWTAAEAQAYYAWLKERFKVTLLVPTSQTAPAS